MTTINKIRKDCDGNIISKYNKNYHINFNKLVEIISIESYKKYNILTGNDEDKRKKGNFIDDYNNVEVRDFSNNEHKCGTSFGKCYLF